MFKTGVVTALIMVLPTFSAANGQDYSIERIDAPPDADEISAELTAQLAATGIRVKRGTSRTACEIWFCKQWDVETGFQPTEDRLYPFSPGQLIGLLHFSRRGKDFRDQSVSSGWYTLRFGLQPIDGNHEGTSLTRDFVVMVDAEQDGPEKTWDVKELMESSAEVAGSTHPAMLSLKKPTDDLQLAIRHEEANDWWILHAVGKGTDGGKSSDVAIDLIVVGHAAE
jgi:hypothetical protein